MLVCAAGRKSGGGGRQAAVQGRTAPAAGVGRSWVLLPEWAELCCGAAARGLGCCLQACPYPQCLHIGRGRPEHALAVEPSCPSLGWKLQPVSRGLAQAAPTRRWLVSLAPHCWVPWPWRPVLPMPRQPLPLDPALLPNQASPRGPSPSLDLGEDVQGAAGRCRLAACTGERSAAPQESACARCVRVSFLPRPPRAHLALHLRVLPPAMPAPSLSSLGATGRAEPKASSLSAKWGEILSEMIPSFPQSLGVNFI